jgi:hypothetical protein
MASEEAVSFAMPHQLLTKSLTDSLAMRFNREENRWL